MASLRESDAEDSLNSALLGILLRRIRFSPNEKCSKYWARAGDGADVAPLRAILSRIAISDKTRVYIAARNDEELRNDLLRRITWDCGAPPLDEIRTQLEELLILYAEKRLKVPAAEAKQRAATILQHLLSTAVEPNAGKRKLTSAELFTLLDNATRISLSRADVETIVKTAAVTLGQNAGQANGPPLQLATSPQLDIAKEALERDFASRYRRAVSAGAIIPH